jgi:flagellar motor switch/type III secretory pathway protein FliN
MSPDQHPDEPSALPVAADPELSRITAATETRKGTTPNAVRFAVTVELPVAQLPLAQLRLLVAGQQLVPSIPLTPDDLLLQVNGSRLGRGSLLTIDRRWALRITQLGATSESL